MNDRKQSPTTDKGKEGIRCALRESDGGKDSRRGMDKLAYPLTLASTAAPPPLRPTTTPVDTRRRRR